MKFSIESKELAAGLSRIIGTVPKRSPMPVLSNIKIAIEGFQLRLIATDMDTTTETLVNASIEEGGESVLLPAQRLYDTITALSDTTLTVTISNSYRTTIETGNAKYQLTGMETADFPTRVEDGTTEVQLSLPTARLRMLVDAVSYATSNDEFRPAMTGILFQVRGTELRAVATDGFRLATRNEVFTEPITEQEIDVIIGPEPLKTALKHITEESVRIQLRSRQAIFSDSRTTVVMRLIDETYPNWNSVVPTTNTNVLILRRDDLLATLKRVSLYSNAQTRQIRFDLMEKVAESTMLVKADDADTGGEAKESLPIQYNGEQMELGLNGVFLKETLSHISSDEIEIHLSTPLRPLLLYPVKQGSDNQYFHLLMPVRLNA